MLVCDECEVTEEVNNLPCFIVNVPHFRSHSEGKLGELDAAQALSGFSFTAESKTLLVTFLPFHQLV